MASSRRPATGGRGDRPFAARGQEQPSPGSPPGWAAPAGNIGSAARRAEPPRRRPPQQRPPTTGREGTPPRAPARPPAMPRRSPYPNRTESDRAGTGTAPIPIPLAISPPLSLPLSRTFARPPAAQQRRHRHRTSTPTFVSPFLCFHSHVLIPSRFPWVAVPDNAVVAVGSGQRNQGVEPRKDTRREPHASSANGGGDCRGGKRPRLVSGADRGPRPDPRRRPMLPPPSRGWEDRRGRHDFDRPHKRDHDGRSGYEHHRREARGFWERDHNGKMVFCPGTWEQESDREAKRARTHDAASVEKKAEADRTGPAHKDKPVTEEQARQYQLEVLEQEHDSLPRDRRGEDSHRRAAHQKYMRQNAQGEQEDTCCFLGSQGASCVSAS